MLRRFPAGTGAVLHVPAPQLSQAVGQKRANIAHWAEIGYPVQVVPDNGKEPFLTIGEITLPVP